MAFPRKKHQRPEHFLQVRSVNRLKDEGVYCFAVPNGGKRDAIDGFNLKCGGVLKGVADLVIVLNGRVIFVEFKNGNKGVQSPEQKEFQKNVEALGHPYFIWRTDEDVKDFIKGIKNEEHQQVDTYQDF